MLDCSNSEFCEEQSKEVTETVREISDAFTSLNSRMGHTSSSADGVDQDVLPKLKASAPSASLLIPSGASAAVSSEDQVQVDDASTTSALIYPMFGGPNTSHGKFLIKLDKEADAFF